MFLYLRRKESQPQVLEKADNTVMFLVFQTSAPDPLAVRLQISPPSSHQRGFLPHLPDSLRLSVF